MLAKRATDIIDGGRFYSTCHTVFISIRESSNFGLDDRQKKNREKKTSYHSLSENKHQIYDVHTNHLKLPTERKIASSLKQSNFNKLPFLFLSSLRLFLSIECSIFFFGVISLEFFSFSFSLYIYLDTISKWASVKKLKSNISMALDKNKFRLNTWTKKKKKWRKQITWIQTPQYMSACTNIQNWSGALRKHL